MIGFWSIYESSVTLQIHTYSTTCFDLPPVFIWYMQHSRYNLENLSLWLSQWPNNGNMYMDVLHLHTRASHCNLNFLLDFRVLVDHIRSSCSRSPCQLSRLKCIPGISCCFSHQRTRTFVPGETVKFATGPASEKPRFTTAPAVRATTLCAEPASVSYMAF